MSFHAELVHGPDLEALEVRGLHGVEHVGQLYRYRMLLLPSRHLSWQQIDALMTEPCALATRGQNAHGTEEHVHGVLCRMDQLSGSEGSGSFYYAELVPRAWLLTRNVCTRVFTNRSAESIIGEILENYGFRQGHDFSFHLLTPARSLPYVVQYEESDWHFIQRWAEHEGYSIAFKQTDQGERLLFMDSPRGARSDEAPTVLRMGNASLASTGSLDEDIIVAWRRRHRRTSGRVALIDYHAGQNTDEGHPPRTDPTWLVQQQSASAAELGVTTTDPLGLPFGAFGCETRVVSFAHGTHPDGATGAAQHLAKVRAGRLLSQRVEYTALCNSRHLHAGSVFRFDASAAPDEATKRTSDGRTAFAEEDGKSYFVTGLTIRFGLDVDAPPSDSAGVSTRFSTELFAVPATIPYQPPRSATWPRIDGVMSAHVAGFPGSADDQQSYAPIDDHGRYRVRLPFALRGANAEYAWVRMAQPATGQGYGTHLPLHAGAEVLLAHERGNPDRPVIVGAVPNGAMFSPVAASDRTKSRIQSSGAISIEMDDDTRDAPHSGGAQS